jgi:Xaa-Pro aminopeptidase
MNEVQAKLHHAIQSHGFDAVMATGPDNFTYLTQAALPFAPSFPDRKALVLQTKDGSACVISPHRWTPALRDQGWQGEFIPYPEGTPYRELLTATIQALTGKGLMQARIGFDSSRMPQAMHDALTQALPNIKWRPCDGLLRDLRMIKTAPEQELLQKAARQSQRAIVSALNHIEGTVDAVSYTLAETAERVRVHVGEFGGAATGHIGAVQGANACHYYVPPHGKLEEGSLLRLDLTNEYRGYWSCAGRTVSIGQPRGAQVKAYGDNLHLKAIAAGMLRRGVTCEQVFSAVADEADRRGIPFLREAGVGHGIGTSEREAPYLAAHDATPLQPGMVLALDILSFGPTQELIRSVDTYVIRGDGAELMSWYRNWDRLYAVVGTTARHG